MHQNIEVYLTPGAQMAFWTPFFPFGLKLKPVLGRRVMISVKTFSPDFKTVSSSFIRNIYFLISFITFINLSLGLAKYEKGKFSVPWELSAFGGCVTLWPPTYVLVNLIWFEASVLARIYCTRILLGDLDEFQPSSWTWAVRLLSSDHLIQLLGIFYEFLIFGWKWILT